MSDSTHNILHDSITITMLEEDSRPWNSSPWTLLTTTLVRRHYVLSAPPPFFSSIKTFRFALRDILYQPHNTGTLLCLTTHITTSLRPTSKGLTATPFSRESVSTHYGTLQCIALTWSLNNVSEPKGSDQWQMSELCSYKTNRTTSKDGFTQINKPQSN